MEEAIPGPGILVVLYLRDPREKAWGVLLKMETSGLWMKGIELEAFDDWVGELAAGGEPSLGPSTFFVPLARVEKMVADRRTGQVPSLAERLEGRLGVPAQEVLDAGPTKI